MIQYLPAIASGASSIYGAIKEGQQRKEMKRERQKWGAQNEALFNKDYYADYTQRADAQNLIKKMRDESRSQNKIDNNVATVTGASPEAINAQKQRRNQNMTSLYGNIGAMSSQLKDRSKDRFLAQRSALQGMEYDEMAANADSANNMLYNGIKGVANTDWAGIVTGQAQSNAGKLAQAKIDNSAVRNAGTGIGGVTVSGKGVTIPTKLPGY